MKRRFNFLKWRFVTLKRHFNFGKKHEKGDKIPYYPHKVIYCIIAISHHKIYKKHQVFNTQKQRFLMAFCCIKSVICDVVF
jgi:hypothetical protein